MAVVAVVCDDVVARLESAYSADSGGFLTDVEMQETSECCPGNSARPQVIFKSADQQHKAIHPQEFTRYQCSPS